MPQSHDTASPLEEPQQSHKRLMALVLAALLIGSFFLRAYQPQTRSPIWPWRASEFYEAVKTRDWDRTYQSRHPGVTTMAIGAFAYYIYEQVEDTPLENLLTWGAAPYLNDFGLSVTAGMAVISLALVGLLLATALALKRLAGWSVALSATALLGIAPFYLTQSRVFHVDALAATFMLLSAILLLVYLEDRAWRYLVLSGFVGGLALLSKTPSVFLIPFTGLGLLVYLVRDIGRTWDDSHHAPRLRLILNLVANRLLGPLLIWIFMAALPFALWPAMWTHPVMTLDNVISGATEHVENPHINPRFFAGRIYSTTPPAIAYYPTALAFRMTFISLAFFVFSILLYSLPDRFRARPVAAPIYWLLIAYVVFFDIQMTLSAKQIDRYILPAQAMLEVAAAIGLVGFSRLLRRASSAQSSRSWRHLKSAAIAVPLALHGLVTMIFFPDFGAHYNYLLGNNQVATRLFSFLGQEEGFHFVAKYLWQQSEQGSTSLVTSFHDIWRQYEPGWDEAAEAKYEIITITNVRRGQISPEALEFKFATQRPVVTVRFDGVDYVWLFPIDGAARGPTMEVNRGWVGFTVVAWMAVFAIAGLSIWAFRQTDGSFESQTAAQDID